MAGQSARPGRYGAASFTRGRSQSFLDPGPTGAVSELLPVLGLARDPLQAAVAPLWRRRVAYPLI
jgi:hypothetical protein